MSMSNSDISIIQSEIMTEMDELDKFIQQVIENDEKKNIPQASATEESIKPVEKVK